MFSLISPLYWLYEQRLLKQIQSASALPHHLGLILDGNRRFAKENGLAVPEGHAYGAKKVEDLLKWCVELQIQVVTIWVFSTENFQRDATEVQALMELFVSQANRLRTDPVIHEKKVRVKVIGERTRFPQNVRGAMEALEEATKAHNGLTLQIALGYGGRTEIVDAVRGLVTKLEATPNGPMAPRITEATISEHLYTNGIPDPDFIIRTSGEIRLSGFLLWQAAYSEYLFIDVFWPAFRKVDFLRAIRSYQQRKRRFGK